MVLGLADQLAGLHNVSLLEGGDLLCSLLPAPLAQQCSIGVHVLGPVLLPLLHTTASPDLACWQAGLCLEPRCHLFPRPSPALLPPPRPATHPALRPSQQPRSAAALHSLWLCWIPGVRQLCDAFDAAFHRLVPGLDVDKVFTVLLLYYYLYIILLLLYYYL